PLAAPSGHPGGLAVLGRLPLTWQVEPGFSNRRNAGTNAYFGVAGGGAGLRLASHRGHPAAVVSLASTAARRGTGDAGCDSGTRIDRVPGPFAGGPDHGDHAGREQALDLFRSLGLGFYYRRGGAVSSSVAPGG